MDLDQDGDLDLVSGSWPGRLYHFEQLGNQQFAKPTPIEDAAGTPIHLGLASTVFVVDWHDDGDLDLLVGNVKGDVYLVANRSQDARLQLQPAEKVVRLPAEIGDAHPIAADWDGDGALDLLVGHSEGGVLLWRNEGTSAAPRFGSPRELIPHSPTITQEDRSQRDDAWGLRAKICVVDWNDDGKLDLLLGDYSGDFSGKPRQTPAELAREREALAQLPQLQVAWAAQFKAYRALLADNAGGDRDPEIARALATLKRLKAGINECQRVEEDFAPRGQSHGYVWLFQRQ